MSKVDVDEIWDYYKLMIYCFNFGSINAQKK